MIITPHLLVGAAIGSKIHSWWAVAILSFASHYILDAIPHPAYQLNFLKTKTFGKKTAADILKLGVDFFSGFLFIFLVAEKTASFSYIALGMFMAILPDFLQVLYRFYKNRFLEPFQIIHDYFHFDKTKNFAWQSAVTVFTIFVAITSIITILIK